MKGCIHLPRSSSHSRHCLTVHPYWHGQKTTQKNGKIRPKFSKGVGEGGVHHFGEIPRKFLFSSDRSSYSDVVLLYIRSSSWPLFSDFHSVDCNNWRYKSHSMSLKQYQCSWSHRSHPIHPIQVIHPIHPIGSIHPIHPIHPIYPIHSIHPIIPIHQVNPIHPIN